MKRLFKCFICIDFKGFSCRVARACNIYFDCAIEALKYTSSDRYYNDYNSGWLVCRCEVIIENKVFLSSFLILLPVNEKLVLFSRGVMDYIFI